VAAKNLNWSALLSPAMYNYSTLLGGPIFEEPGWRGFALPRLEARLKPLPAALLLGVIWTAWHLPLFWYPGWTSLPIWFYLVLTVALSVIITMTANIARFGVIAPILVHAANNTVGRYLDGVLRDTEPGSGGFLKQIAALLAAHGHGMNINISFTTLIAVGAWLGAGLIILSTKGRLGYGESEEF
jgi:membrane protease YdiL (CAAX protease family)